jgi:hypothetical protein
MRLASRLCSNTVSDKEVASGMVSVCSTTASKLGDRLEQTAERVERQIVDVSDAYRARCRGADFTSRDDLEARHCVYIDPFWWVLAQRTTRRLSEG